MALSLLRQKLASVVPDDSASWSPLEIVVETLASALGLTTAQPKDEYDSRVVFLSGSTQSIPIGTLGFRFTVLSGTVLFRTTLTNSKAIPVGTTISSGGYLGKGSVSIVPRVDAQLGTAIIVYDING